LIKQVFALLRHSMRLEISESQRVLSSFLFGMTILFLFAFAMGDVPENVKVHLVLSEIFLCIFLVLQLVHQRILSVEEEDRAMDVLVTSSVSISLFYLVKVFLAVLLSGIIIFPFLAFMQILHGVNLWNGLFLCVVALIILALSSLGVLLSQMTEKAAGRELLFPLLYFPLTIPVLLSGVQASFCLWNIHNPDGFDLWLGLLGAFCIIYLTLGVLLFEELIGLD